MYKPAELALYRIFKENIPLTLNGINIVATIMFDQQRKAPR